MDLDNDGGVTLEDAVGGMPTATPPPAAPQPGPAPDLSQPLLQDDGDQNAADDDGDEGDDDQPRTGKRSLVGDLVRERERRQTVETNLQQSQHLLQQVMSLPGGMDLLQAAATGRQVQPRTAPGQPSAEDQELLAEAQETAQDLGLYDAEGKPDLRTAARIVLRDRKRTEQILSRAIQPLQRTTMSLAAQPVIQHVLTVADSFGIDRNLVLQGLQATPPEHINNPEVQQAVLMMALGTQTMLGQQQGAPAAQPPTVQQQIAQQLQQQPAVRPGQYRQPRAAMRPPIFTEQPGGRPRAAAAQLDSVFRDRLKSTGMKDADIDGAVGRFVPGAPNRLE